MSNAAQDAFDTLDHATLRHLCQWLDYAVRDEDRASTCEAIRTALGHSPELIAEGKTWREIADRA